MPVLCFVDGGYRAAEYRLHPGWYAIGLLKGTKRAGAIFGRRRIDGYAVSANQVTAALSRRKRRFEDHASLARWLAKTAVALFDFAPRHDGNFDSGRP
jgi:hypothetical protein